MTEFMGPQVLSMVPGNDRIDWTKRPDGAKKVKPDGSF
jgi:hypothetical protein